MAGEIQTSFIPKSPITTSAHQTPQSSIGFMTVISLILVLSSVAVFGGAFIYQQVLIRQISGVEGEIAALKEKMPLENLKNIEHLNIALTNANNLLNNHVSSNQVFTLIQDSTIPAVRYTTFNFSGAEVKVRGTARTYEDVAAQAKVFDGMTSEITSFEFSDFTFDKLTKNVSFNLVLTVDPAVFHYTGELVGSTTTIPRDLATSTGTNIN